MEPTSQVCMGLSGPGSCTCLSLSPRPAPVSDPVPAGVLQRDRGDGRHVAVLQWHPGATQPLGTVAQRTRSNVAATRVPCPYPDQLALHPGSPRLPPPRPSGPRLPRGTFPSVTGHTCVVFKTLQALAR